VSKAVNTLFSVLTGHDGEAMMMNMITKLTKPVSRITAYRVTGNPVVMMMAPLGSQADARLGLRLLGKRTQYVARVSDLYRILAAWHGNKERSAKRDARRMGISWQTARKKFLADNSIAMVKRSAER
jgi:hypothetical protein